MGLCKYFGVSSVICAWLVIGASVTLAHAEQAGPPTGDPAGAGDAGAGDPGGGAAPPPAGDGKPKPNHKRVHVGLIGYYGAFWMPSGVETGLADVTSMRGLGLRVTKGLAKAFALESEFVGAVTGTGTFPDLMADGAQGTLHRSASLGMFQLGVLVRSRRGILEPYGRLGVGLQAAVFGSDFLVAGQPRDRPDDTFDMDGFYRVGAGCDVRMGASAVAGLTTSYTQGQTQKTFTIGLHLTYGL